MSRLRGRRNRHRLRRRPFRLLSSRQLREQRLGQYRSAAGALFAAAAAAAAAAAKAGRWRFQRPRSPLDPGPGPSPAEGGSRSDCRSPRRRQHPIPAAGPDWCRSCCKSKWNQGAGSRLRRVRAIGIPSPRPLRALTISAMIRSAAGHGGWGAWLLEWLCCWLRSWVGTARQLDSLIAWLWGSMGIVQHGGSFIQRPLIHSWYYYLCPHAHAACHDRDHARAILLACPIEVVGFPNTGGTPKT